jgi:CheY-like chemotaxis protein
MTVGAALHYGFLPWSRWTESVEHVGALLNMTAWLVVISIRTHRRQRVAEVTAVRERQVVARLAVDLRRQKEIAEEASRAKSRFLAAASHDLRQPVHAMGLFIGALRNVPMNAEGQHLIKQIEMSADAIDRLFAALLDISKLDAGVVEMRRQTFAIDTVITRVCDDCATSSKGLVVVIDDEKSIRTGMSALLTNWGYQVLAAGSGDEAIQLLADCAAMPDLLICDLRLRDGENGIEVVERLRTEYNASIPAMLVTGDTSTNRLLEARASELLVLHKPVPNSKLRAATAHLIATGSFQRESSTEV